MPNYLLSMGQNAHGTPLNVLDDSVCRGGPAVALEACNQDAKCMGLAVPRGKLTGCATYSTSNLVKDSNTDFFSKDM